MHVGRYSVAAIPRPTNDGLTVTGLRRLAGTGPRLVVVAIPLPSRIIRAVEGGSMDPCRSGLAKAIRGSYTSLLLVRGQGE